MPLPKPVKIAHLTAPRAPVWKGPCAAGPAGGVTQSMLGAFQQCRERFRLRYVEGLRAAERFSHRMEYGNMWHVCEELSAEGNYNNGLSKWEVGLGRYTKELGDKYPLDREEIQKWYGVCRTQFPLYLDYWAKNDDVKARTPLLVEQVFDVPYRLPSGRAVRLRGKWDGVCLIGKGKAAGVWLDEHKTKSRIDENVLRRQLTFDLQTMTYLVALEAERSRLGDSTIKNRLTYRDGQYRVQYPLKGVRYNVVRRTEHRQGKKETAADFCRRVGKEIEKAPADWFMRWNVEVGSADVAAFRRKCLDPLLEQLCDWWEWVSFMTERGGSVWDNDVAFGARPDKEGNGIHASAIHWQTPFGVGTWLLDGGSSDYDHLLETGSETGLRRTEELFTELQ